MSGMCACLPKHVRALSRLPTADVLVYAYGALVMNICACAATSSDTIESRAALSETASPLRHRASCRIHNREVSVRCAVSHETRSSELWCVVMQIDAVGP
eukprot:1532390-Prymnesium_polylepis.2